MTAMISNCQKGRVRKDKSVVKTFIKDMIRQRYKLSRQNQGQKQKHESRRSTNGASEARQNAKARIQTVVTT